MEEKREIIFDPLKHGSILRRIKIEFFVLCALREQDNDFVRRCESAYKKVCAGEPVTMAELRDLLSEMYHPLLRPLKVKLARLDPLENP